MPFPVRSFTGPRTETGLHARGLISGKGLFQFRYGRCKGPVPELGSMCVVPFPVLTGLCHFRHCPSLGPVPELDSMLVVSFPVSGSFVPVRLL